MLMMLLGLSVTTLGQAEEVVGERPYEMVWADRTEDDHPPLVDFEDLEGWTVEINYAEEALARWPEQEAAATEAHPPPGPPVTFVRSREQQIWGKYVGKLTYRGAGTNPQIWIRPPDPIPIGDTFDTVSCWIHGNNWAWVTDTTTPQVPVDALFVDAADQEFGVHLETVRWKEWFVCHRRLTSEQIERVKGGARFAGFHIRNGRNEEDRVLYFDSLAVFTEDFAPLQFEPRPERGIPMFPGQTTGTNTGPGKLPFPTRPETILPACLTPPVKLLVHGGPGEYHLNHVGDVYFNYVLKPETGTLGDIEVVGGVPYDPVWRFRPCVDGGVFFHSDNGPTPPDGVEHLGTELVDDPEFANEYTVEGSRKVVSRWRMSLGDRSAEVTYVYRLWGKSLVIDVMAPGGEIAEVRYGRAVGLENPRLVTVPFYPAGAGQPRPAVVVSGPPDDPLFLMANTCWYLSNASQPFAVNEVKDEGTTYNGGTRYTAKTDGERNDVYERFFITVSPRFEEVLPNIPNPKSPWMEVTGTRVWRAHGAGDRERDKAHWRECHRYGMTEVAITDHETGWRDGGESFTFRTRTAPKKGGDEGQFDYARVMQDELGFVYGPYNNYTDFAPVNEYWSVDLVSRLSDNQLHRAWARCYAPKPSRAVEFCALLAPQIEEKFHFSTAYCDVHTAVAPWDRVDYDYRVPGAGTFAATFYSYGEIMLHQKAAWDGPVYSEGNNHSFYTGLTDGNYGQDQRYRPNEKPWLVDFDLLKMHDLGTSFGMGNPGMFFGRGHSFGSTREEIDNSVDRFLAATVAFGHTGFLTYEGGLRHALRSYYMLQQLHSQYALSSVDQIRYADADGNLLDTSAAVATDAFKRSQIVTRYQNGCVTAVNGHAAERMTVEAHGRKLDLPPNSYAGWMEDGSIEVYNGERDGHKADYAATPAHLYVDGRGKFTRFERAAGNGIGICRLLGDGSHELIPFEEAECGFVIGAARAAALDKERGELGPAEVRVSRGLTYVMPVEGAFSYLLTAAAAPQAELDSDRDEVVPGERVVVRGKDEHELQIPPDAEPGDRIWREFEGAWIDFTVVSLADAEVALEGDDLRVELTSNLAEPTDAELTFDNTKQTLALRPDEPAVATIPLGPPQGESTDVVALQLRAGELTQRIERLMRTTRGFAPIAPLPEEYEVGMRVRGGEETGDLGKTRAYVVAQKMTCGDVAKQGVFMHPPWTGAVGYSFAKYAPVALPADKPAAFRASVGKKDGSDPGDGVLFKIAIVDQAGASTDVAQTVLIEHEWVELTADLTAWAGQTVRAKIVSDVGEEDNSSGDWACWADMRFETLEPVLMRVLEEDVERYRREAGPFPIEGLTVADLRQAKSGLLHYDGMGLSGGGAEYGSFAVVNGIELGNMAPAGGGETEGQWAEDVTVPLTAEAIQSLTVRNVFTLRNPRQDWFKVRRFWIELELADGRRCSSDISTAAFTQPPGWPYAEGIGVPHGENIEAEIWFPAEQ